MENHDTQQLDEELQDLLSSAMMPDKMQCHPVTLKFRDECAQFEQDFLDDYNRESLLYLRFGLAIGSLFLAVFAILDFYIAHEVYLQLWILRFAVLIPAGIIIIALSFFRGAERWIWPPVSLFLTLTGAGIIYMSIIAPYPANQTYYAGLILLFMFSYSMARLRFLQATAIGITVVLLYLIAAYWISDTPALIFMNNSFFFISSNIIGMIISYQLEHGHRQSWYYNHLNQLKYEIELESRMMQVANDLAATVAHEFNTPLAILQNVYDLMEMENVSDAEKARHLEKVPAQIARMQMLVEKLVMIREIRELDYAAGMKILDIHDKTPE